MKNNKSYCRTCQRSEKPDELAMIALKKPEFAKGFIEAFKKAKRGVACQQQK